MGGFARLFLGGESLGKSVGGQFGGLFWEDRVPCALVLKWFVMNGSSRLLSCLDSLPTTAFCNGVLIGAFGAFGCVLNALLAGGNVIFLAIFAFGFIFAF